MEQTKKKKEKLMTPPQNLRIQISCQQTRLQERMEMALLSLRLNNCF